MKNIFTKILVSFIVIGAILIGFKAGDNAIKSANASTNTNQSCGINNGWIWNGTQCVNTCDVNHPWDPIAKRCSTNFGYGSNNYVYGSNTNCALAYGSNFYYNGKNCVQITAGQNANYYGNPYNGGTTNPVYSNTNPYTNPYYNTNSGYTYTYNTNTNVNTNTVYNSNPNTNFYNTYNQSSYSSYPSYPYTNSQIIYQNTWDSPYHPNMDGQIINNLPRKNADYYIYIISTTTSQPQGTPIYLSTNNNYRPYGHGYYSEYYSYSNWYGGGYYDIYGNYIR